MINRVINRLFKVCYIFNEIKFKVRSKKVVNMVRLKINKLLTFNMSFNSI